MGDTKDNKVHDVLVIGAGPAGLSAAIYASRYKLETAIVSKEVGGAINEAHLVENYPGYKGTGFEMMQHWQEHVESFGLKIIEEEVSRIVIKDNLFVSKAGSHEILSKTVIFAAGMQRRKLNIPGEAEFLGRGVSYCATCDAAFFRDKNVAVIGGNDSAAMAADLLSRYAKKVYLVYRKDKLRAEPIWVERVENNVKVEIITNSNVSELKGTKMLEKAILDNGKALEIDGIFIEIGSVPSLALTSPLGVEADDRGYIKVGPDQSTSVKGFYAAGDITTGSNGFRQVVTAAAEGAVAAQSAYKFLTGKK